MLAIRENIYHPFQEFYKSLEEYPQQVVRVVFTTLITQVAVVMIVIGAGLCRGRNIGSICLFIGSVLISDWIVGDYVTQWVRDLRIAEIFGHMLSVMLGLAHISYFLGGFSLIHICE